VFEVDRLAVPQGWNVKKYRVAVSGISGGSTSSYSYTVRLFHA
jgi:hypothetical protein